jgi:hypothetical protein
MTRYTVTWLEEAQDELAQIWTAAEERKQVTDAANAIDAELLYDAECKGQPLAEGLRTLCIPPLHVLFTVSVSDRLVEVSLLRIDRELSPNSEGNGQQRDPEA